MRWRFCRSAEQQAMIGMQIPIGTRIMFLKQLIHRAKIYIRALLGSHAHVATSIAIDKEYCPLPISQAARSSIIALHCDTQPPARAKLNPPLKGALKA